MIRGRRARVQLAIVELHDQNRKFPTVQQLIDHLGMTPASVLQAVAALRRSRVITGRRRSRLRLNKWVVRKPIEANFYQLVHDICHQRVDRTHAFATTETTLNMYVKVDQRLGHDGGIDAAKTFLAKSLMTGNRKR